MNKIASFTVNHLDLLAGVYVSRKDYQGDVVLTTFDLRFTRPNVEAPMDTAGIHTIEHLMATFLRNNKEWADKTIDAIKKAAYTGEYGDGKIFCYPVEKAVKIRTGETGYDAIQRQE